MLYPVKDYWKIMDLNIKTFAPLFFIFRTNTHSSSHLHWPVSKSISGSHVFELNWWLTNAHILNFSVVTFPLFCLFFFCSEALHAWRSKARCNIVPAERLHELFEELEFNPTEKQSKSEGRRKTFSLRNWHVWNFFNSIIDHFAYDKSY